MYGIVYMAVNKCIASGAHASLMASSHTLVAVVLPLQMSLNTRSTDEHVHWQRNKLQLMHCIIYERSLDIYCSARGDTPAPRIIFAIVLIVGD